MAKTQLNTKVCILGAGPAGIVTANILLRHGIDCVVMDQYSREKIDEDSRAGVIESTTVALLEQYDLASTLLERRLTQERCEFRMLRHWLAL